MFETTDIDTSVIPYQHKEREAARLVAVTINPGLYIVFCYILFSFLCCVAMKAEDDDCYYRTIVTRIDVEIYQTTAHNK